MKTNNLKKLFQATVLSLAVTTSASVFAEYSDKVVAIVGNSAILQSDLDQSVAEAVHQLNAQKKTIPPENVLRAQLLNQLILQNAQLEQVKRYGLKLDEKSLNEAVMSVAQQSGANSLEAFQQKLDNIAPGTYELLRSRIANDLLIQRLRQQQVMSRIKISDQDVENFLKSPEGQAAVGSQAHVLHVRVSGSQNPAELQKVAQQVKNELNGSSDLKQIEKKYSNASIKVEGADMGFRALSGIPAELAARVSVLKPGQTSELITVQDGVHVLKLLDRKSNEQKALIPQYKTRHILIKTSEIVSAENAKQMIDSIYKRLQAGEDFSTLAATYSNDPGSAQDGGNLGWVSPGMMVPEFDQRMQNTTVNQISEPFQTQFGWHVLQVTDSRQQDMTHEYQQRMARQILGERQFDTEIDAWLRELRSNTYVEIKDPSLDPHKANKS
ncbi:peptidylprolyl isomerase [Acinetobacter rudis]|uniref:Chaperone SurA n=1 Tax=Acinetobacter rudis TaxID=632955 RepID=A0AAW8J8G7_9GAMM|nr:peptidylprolyl isomerase [Acinetobacter rudis]MDQ8935373.1 peptidylprolyl isomerase [Acinetobacter rudis]MDQ9017636.1 peptidylprolyl isomerase [Acinetobacter rudis]